MLDIGDISGKRFLASGRLIPPDGDIIDHIHRLYPEYAANVDEVFGFVPERLRLYGGRPPRSDNGLSDQHLGRLRDRGIGFSLNLTNHHLTDETYAEALPTLRRLHVEGNSVTCTNDELAQRVRNDFPKFKLKASVLKHLNTRAKMDAALTIYDTAVVPMHLSDDEQFLGSLENKSRIVPWATLWCGYTCRQWACWPVASRKWMGVANASQSPDQELRCRENRANTPHMAFRLDLPKFADFKRFKLSQPSWKINLVK